MSAASFSPFDLARSAGVCKGYQNELKKHSLILGFDVSPKHHREIHCSSFSLSLKSKETSLSLPLILSFSS
jgi:hypothetical protein